MTIIQRAARAAAAALTVLTIAACSSGGGAGGLGEVLGAVLGGAGGAGAGGQAQQAAGIVRGVNTQNQQISLELSNGQTAALLFDQNTKVVYQNQLYQVGNLENGDRVEVRVRQVQQGYYTDSIHVTQSAQGTGGAGTAAGSSASGVQSLQGTVRQVDRANGLFTVDVSNNVTLTVSMPYNASTADRNKLQSLRQGDYVRFYGVYLNNQRVELRQFY